MSSDTQPTQPVTPVTADPSRRHTRCDGRKWAVNCANGSCDRCDGSRPTPSHPSQAAFTEQHEGPAAQPVTRGESGSLAERVASALVAGEAPTHTAGDGLALAPLSIPTPTPSLYYTVTPVDARGRLADRSPIRALGWRPEQPVTITLIRQIVITAQAGGADSITRQGHLRLAARIRHSCRLNTGDRLLVAAAPIPGVLVIYTMALLESILLEHYATRSPSEAPR